MLDYFNRMHALGIRLSGLLSTGLGLDPSFFEGCFLKPMSALRLLHYSSEVGQDQCYRQIFSEEAGRGGWGVMLPFACVGYRAAHRGLVSLLDPRAVEHMLGKMKQPASISYKQEKPSHAGAIYIRYSTYTCFVREPGYCNNIFSFVQTRALCVMTNSRDGQESNV